MLAQLQRCPSMTVFGNQTTPFGAVLNPDAETLKPHAPDHLYRVDLLFALKEVWGSSITNNRAALYRLVSGDCSDLVLQQTSAFFCRRSSAYQNYVFEKYYFGDTRVSLTERIIAPARELINQRFEEVYSEIISRGGEVYAVDKDYVYCDVGGIEGGEMVA